MADSLAFTYLCTELEDHTGIDRLEARGTVRIALKAAGLEPATVSGTQLAIAVTRMLPDELERRGVDDAASICQTLAAGLDALQDERACKDSPESIFNRFGRD